MMTELSAQEHLRLNASDSDHNIDARLSTQNLDEAKEEQISPNKNTEEFTEYKAAQNDEKVEPNETQEDSIEQKYETNATKLKSSSTLKKTITLYSTLDIPSEELPMPYEDTYTSKIKYYFETFLVIHPRIHALFLLYSATWPRGLVLLDMYTDIKVAYQLYIGGQSLWFMLSTMFVVLPFVLVWTVSLRFIQKFIQTKRRTKYMSILINIALTLYIFPPIGALVVALYEVYLVFHDVYNGIKCFIFGTGLVETQSLDAQAMKKYRRCIEIFSESVLQSMLQLYMYIRKVPINTNDLLLSLGISMFNLLINAYHFRKEAKLHGMSVAEYALSVLQLSEIPIFRLVPRLPAVKKGQLEFINLAGFAFDKESITPMIEAFTSVPCILSSLKISLGSLLNLDPESCRLIGSIIFKRRIQVFISRAYSLLNIKTLFEQIDDDKNGYLDEKEFENALKLLNNGLLYLDETKRKRIFKRLAIRRIKKRDKVYFHDFFKSIASIENEKLQFDISQIDYPIHYVFRFLSNKIKNGDVTDNDSDLLIIEKLFCFCAGLGCFDQVDRSMNNHVFYPIIDILNDLDKCEQPSNALSNFVNKCFKEIVKSNAIINNASKLLTMRNTLFEKEIEEGKYKQFVIDMYNNNDDQQLSGLNIFEYCFAFDDENISNKCLIFVHLLNLYLNTATDTDDEKLAFDKTGLLYHIYNAPKMKWTDSNKLPFVYAAKEGLFEVVDYFSKHFISHYSKGELFDVCVELLKNEKYQSPDSFRTLLKYAKKINDLELVNSSSMASIIAQTRKNIARKQNKTESNESQMNDINRKLLKYIDILHEYGFDFVEHSALNVAISHKDSDMVQHIIDLCRQQSDDSIKKLFNTSEKDTDIDIPILFAFNKTDLVNVKLLLMQPEQDCNLLFSAFSQKLEYRINHHSLIKFIHDLISIEAVNFGLIQHKIRKRIRDTLKSMINNSELIDAARQITNELCDKFDDKLESMEHKLDAKESESKNDVDQFEFEEDMQITATTNSVNTEKSSAYRDLKTCQKMCGELGAQIQQIHSQTGRKFLSELAMDVNVTEYEPKQRNLCTGHRGKIYALHWGPDSNNIVTAAQDGKLIIWSSHTGNKQLAITLNSAWVMTCAFSPTYEYIASGGLDNTVSIFKTSNQNAQAGPNGGRFRSKDLYRELEKHDGYLSCARFIDDGEIISASGDGTCILWDVENRSAKNIFSSHTGDVMCVDLNPQTKHLFVSGSVDGSAKVWDMRTSDKFVANFHEFCSDVNTVRWFIDGQSIITGSDDGNVRLFDMRSYKKLNEYKDAKNLSLHSWDFAGVTSVDRSASGQWIFSSYDNGQVYLWSTLRGEKICDMPHDSRVSCLGVSPDGYALATGCWDFNLRIFA